MSDTILAILLWVGGFIFVSGVIFWYWWDECGPGHYKTYKWYYDKMENYVPSPPRRSCSNCVNYLAKS